MPLHCSLIEDPNYFETISKDWDSLVESNRHLDAFSLCGFSRAWWKAYGKNKKLRLLIIKDEQKIRLIAPFYCELSEPSVWRLIGHFRADYNNAIFDFADTEVLEHFFSWMNDKTGWGKIFLRRIPEESPLSSPLLLKKYSQNRRGLEKGFFWRSRLRVSHQWKTEHSSVCEEAFKNLEKLTQHRHYRKHINWFEQNGSLEYHCLNESEFIRGYLSDFMALHVREWERKGGESLFSKDENKFFYKYLLEELKNNHVLRFDCLVWNQKIVAAHFGFEWKNKIYYYKPCYDHSVEEHSPGRILLAYIIADSVQKGFVEMDFLLGVEEYKKKYTSHVRKTASLEFSKGNQFFNFKIC